MIIASQTEGAYQQSLYFELVEVLREDVYVNGMSYKDAAAKYGYKYIDNSINSDKSQKSITAGSIADFIFKEAWEYWYKMILEDVLQQEIDRFTKLNERVKRFLFFGTVVLLIYLITK
jgi:hypothetical protein